MQLVWLVGLPSFSLEKVSLRSTKAELRAVDSIETLQASIEPSDRLIVVARYELVDFIKAKFTDRILAIKTMPDGEHCENSLPLVVQMALHDARVQHDMEAAEAVAWSGGGAAAHSTIPS